VGASVISLLVSVNVSANGMREAQDLACFYCNRPFDCVESHVVSKFMIRWLMQNSVDNQILYTWNRKEFAHSMIARPYFCDGCDRGLFGRYIETPFSREVFPDPLNSNAKWGEEYSVRFAALMCYRYGLHSEFEDYTPGHDILAEQFKRLGEQVLRDALRMGQNLFVYPFVYRPIDSRCDLSPGVNHVLTCGFHDRFQAGNGILPNRYFIQLPKMIFLFSEADLTACPGHEGLVELSLGAAFDATAHNTRILGLYSGLLNDAVAHTKKEQSARGKWFHYRNLNDEKLNPDRMLYKARTIDKTLELWQQGHC
jgi:hypothetical protein